MEMILVVGPPVDRHEIVRRVVRQIRAGQYRPPADAVAEQVIAWSLEPHAASRAEVA